jgi:hypothetical protein
VAVTSSTSLLIYKRTVSTYRARRLRRSAVRHSSGSLAMLAAMRQWYRLIREEQSSRSRDGNGRACKALQGQTGEPSNNTAGGTRAKIKGNP